MQSREQGHFLEPMIDVPVMSDVTNDNEIVIERNQIEPQLAARVVTIARAEAEYGRRRIEALAANIEAFIACTDQPVMMLSREGSVNNFNAAWCQAVGIPIPTEPERCMQSLSVEMQDAVYAMLGAMDGSPVQVPPVTIPVRGVPGHSEALVMPVYHLPEVLEGVAVLLR